MLYALGPLDFEVAPFNTHQVGREHAADFAAKELLGSRRSHEFVGDGEEKVKLTGKLFPHKLGGLDSLDMLYSLREGGAPQLLMRGDGVPLGWYLITNVNENSQYLDGQGIGRMIDVEIELLKDDAPDPADYVASLFALFG